MNKYYQAIINTSGDAKALSRVQVLDNTGDIVSIYADKSGTRFTDATGANVNYCEADATGMVEFYWTAASDQTLQVLDSTGELERSIADFANNFSEPGTAANVDAVIGVPAADGNLGTFTGSTIPDSSAVKPALQALETAGEQTASDVAALASTAPGEGAALVGLPSGENVTDKITRMEAQGDFTSFVGLLESEKPAVGAGTLWGSDGIFYTEAAAAATDYHTMTAGGVKLYTRLVENCVSADSFGLIADGSIHPLSERFSTLADAQAAYPLSTAAGFITALTLTIDYAAIQEAVLRAQTGSILPGVIIGMGQSGRGWVITNASVRSYEFNNRGIAIYGKSITTAGQGSTRAGVTVDYHGPVGDPIFDLSGTFHKMGNILIRNKTGARCGIRFRGISDAAGPGRSHLENVSLIEATGMVPYTYSVIEFEGAMDYTFWNNIEYIGSDAVIIDVNGTKSHAAASTPNFTRFRLENSCFNSNGLSGTLLKITNINVEQVIIEATTYNGHNLGGTFVGVDTTQVDAVAAGYGVDNLTLRGFELDSISTQTGVRIGKLTKVNNAVVQSCHGQVGGGATCLFELTLSDLHIDDSYFRAVNGPVVKCLDSTSRVFSLKNTLEVTQGLTDGSLVGNIPLLTQSGGIVLPSGDLNQDHQFFQIDFTTAATTTISARTYADTPRGQWVQGQKVTIIFKNVFGSAGGIINFGSGIDAAALSAIPSQTSISITFVWDNSRLLEIGRSAAIPN